MAGRRVEMTAQELIEAIEANQKAIIKMHDRIARGVYLVKCGLYDTT